MVSPKINWRMRSLNMQPALGEDVSTFLLWVENTRASLGVETRSALHAVFPCLPGEL